MSTGASEDGNAPAVVAPVTLVTGGTSGIGEATAWRLLRDGHRVCVTGRSKDRLAALARRLDAGEALLTAVADVSDYGQVSAAVEQAVSAYGRLDAVVANAGFSAEGTIADGDPEQWREMVLTNVLGPVLLIRAALPALRQSRGRIVLVGSVAGTKYRDGNLYSVTKWAVSALAENTRLMVTGDGIGVTLLAPGRVDTPFWDAAGGPPEGPILTPEDMASMVSWALGQPATVDINTIVVRPVGQSV